MAIYSLFIHLKMVISRSYVSLPEGKGWPESLSHVLTMAKMFRKFLSLSDSSGHTPIKTCTPPNKHRPCHFSGCRRLLSTKYWLFSGCMSLLGSIMKAFWISLICLLEHLLLHLMLCLGDIRRLDSPIERHEDVADELFNLNPCVKTGISNIEIS